LLIEKGLLYFIPSRIMYFQMVIQVILWIVSVKNFLV